MVGTGTQISVFVDPFRRIEGIDLRPLPFGGFIGVGAGLGGGRAYAALREFFRKTVLAVTGQDAEIAWEVTNGMNPPEGTDPLRVDTRFGRTRISPSIRGNIGNIGLSNLTPQHFASGLREGIVSELLGFFGLFSPTERERIDALAGSGNAIGLNDSLRRALEKGFGASLRVPRHREVTAFGAALAAGVASGVISDLAAAGSLVRYKAPQSATR
jgi:sedoheptulokinase